MYIQPMKIYEWDEHKNKINQAAHGIDFRTGAEVFDDPCFVAFVESIKDGEERWHAIGMVRAVTVVAVVHTYSEKGSDEVIRIISCRRASSHERKIYEEAR
jgi:uncharacterized DUF497 family protein